MTIAPKKKCSSKAGGERCSSRQSGPSSPANNDDADHSGQKNRPAESAAASALALRSKLTKRGGCRAVKEAAVKPKRAVRIENTAEVIEEQQEQGCNSDDEYGPGFKDEALEMDFAKRMKEERGFDIIEMEGDGNCMFRAVAHQIYGDQEMHGEIRKFCMEYLSKNRDEYSSFVTEDMEDYITRKRRLDVHGNHLELQVMTEIYARPIELYEYDTKPMKSFNPPNMDENSDAINAPLRLSYHGRTHYNSVVDPFNATIGVGLGLPSFNPGEADRNLLSGALRQSESEQIEEAMLKDKLTMTDWERTEDEMSSAVMQESYNQYLRECKHRASSQKPRSPEQTERGQDLIECRKMAETNKNEGCETIEIPPADSTHKDEPKGNLVSAEPEQEPLNDSPKQDPISEQSGSSSNTRLSLSHGVKRGASSPNLPGCSYDDVTTKTRKLVGESFSSLNVDLCEPGPSTSKTVFGQLNPKEDRKEEVGGSSGLYLELLRAHNFDGDQDLSAVIALSTQEYLDKLRNSTPTNEEEDDE